MHPNTNTSSACRNDGAKRRPLEFWILGFGIYLGFGILGFGISTQLGAQSSPSTLNQIYSNIGNINVAGLPQIRIPLGNNTELERLGFNFTMTHNIVPCYNGSARTEWRISGLRTCVYLDGNGDLVWVRPDAQQIVFSKADNYRQKSMGWTIVVQNGMRDVAFINSDGQKWKYSGGFLKEISDGLEIVNFVTDKETVLLALRRGRASAGNNPVLMRAEYSGAGLLSRLELGQSPAVIFHWSGAAALVSIEGLFSSRMTFDYDNMLLREWNNNGVRTNYTWEPRDDLPESKNISFGIAPVRLKSDSEFHYAYDEVDDVSILRIFRHDGSFVSETRFGDRGIIQKAGDKTTRYIYRDDGTAKKLVIDSE